VLENVVAVVDGFSDTETSRLIKQIHHMGGFVMKTLTSASIGRHRPTHLIAYSALCRSYHVAVDNDMTITTEDWISELWLRRDERNLHRSHLITPQYACLRHIGIALIGFHSSERQHWRTAIESAAGVVHTDVSSSTNIVVLNDARHNFLCKLRRCSQGKRFLDAIFDREEVHFRLADEQSVVSCEFLARSLSDNICGPVRQYSLVVRDAESGYISSGQKRRCLHDHEDHPDQALPTPKRRVGTLCAETLCEDDDMPLTETPSRRLQTLALCSPGSSQQLSTRAVQRRPVRLSECDENEPASFTVGRGMCQRRQRATELLHTERNYVRLLRSLLENVVGPLEAEGSLEKAGLVALHDLDIIFGKLPIICR
jgi:twin BRCT domain